MRKLNYFIDLLLKKQFHLVQCISFLCKCVSTSRSDGCGLDPRPMLDGSGVKAMLRSIPAPNSGSLEKNKKIQVVKWGTPKKYFFKVRKYVRLQDLHNLCTLRNLG